MTKPHISELRTCIRNGSKPDKIGNLSLARFRVNFGGVSIPRFTLSRNQSGSLHVTAPEVYNSHNERIMMLSREIYRSIVVDAIDIYVTMGGRFEEGDYAPRWLELDGDPADWGGLTMRVVEAVRVKP